jgi:diadenosine tetraphosphatase ApaH/serine/threonine PP2A family protein phosphatase
MRLLYLLFAPQVRRVQRRRSPPIASIYNRPVRLLVLSDIHGNLEALEACLDAVPVCCGLEDTSDFNPVAAAAANWTRNELSDRNLDWLREQPCGPVRDEDFAGVQFVHGSPLDEDEYIVSAYVAQESLRSARCPLTFFGHTHIQGAFGRAGQFAEALPLERFNTASSAQALRLKLHPKQHYLVNPGSVGQPRDRDRRAAFAVYDSEQREVLFYRVPYDIAAAQERILMAGLPKMLALRLEEGR